MVKKRTFCRICEPHCPMIATLDEGRIVSLQPDSNHPCGGTACHKGLNFLDVHNDKDRLNYPQRRSNPKADPDGGFEVVSWETALSEIADKLISVREKYGPNAVAVYTGNPLAFDSRGATNARGFIEQLGSQMRFSANSQDAQSKCLAAKELYGSPVVLTAPDVCETDYLLCIGANPLVSRWTIISVPQDSGDVLREIRARGGKVRFVNPRRVESLASDTGETVLIKPGTDVYFLAALVNELYRLKGFSGEQLERYGKNVDALIEFVSRYPAEKVAEVTGVQAAKVREIAQEIVQAESAAFYLSTGVNQSGQGILAYWLNEMLSLVTGNLGRKGGNYKPGGYFDGFQASNGVVTVQTSLGVLEFPNPMGPMAMPGALLADLIDAGDIRALVVVSGNPLLTVGGEDKLRAAFAKLELLVSIDIMPSVTAEMSDYMLPATDFLERADIGLLPNTMQAIPYVQFTDATTPPEYERREVWWILSRLLKCMGLPSPLDAEDDQEGFQVVNALLAASDLSIEALKHVPGHVVMLPQLEAESFFERCLVHADGKIDCCPASFESGGLFERCQRIFDELNSSPEGLKLITLRTPYMHNSWLTNVNRFRRGRQVTNPLHMCEADAKRLGLFEGDTVSVSSEAGTVEATLTINNDLRPGAVAMSHGYGQGRATALRVASQRPGTNYNRLCPTGWDSMEPLSYMSRLSAIPVTVKKAEPGRGRDT